MLTGVRRNCFSPTHWRFITGSSFLHEWILPHSRNWDFLQGLRILRQSNFSMHFLTVALTFVFLQNIHVSFLRTVPPYSHQADVWVEVLKHFKYKKVIFIHSSDTDGRALLGRFQTTSQSLEDDVEIKVQVRKLHCSRAH